VLQANTLTELTHSTFWLLDDQDLGPAVCELAIVHVDAQSGNNLDFQDLSVLLDVPVQAGTARSSVSLCEQYLHFEALLLDDSQQEVESFLVQLAGSNARILLTQRLFWTVPWAAAKTSQQEQRSEMHEQRPAQQVHATQEALLAADSVSHRRLQMIEQPDTLPADRSPEQSEMMQETEASAPHKLRNLLARASRRRSAGTGVAQDAVPSADVGSQKWTIDNLPVSSSPLPGAVLRARELGRGNSIVGGILLSQWRSDTHSVWHDFCFARYSHLVALCHQISDQQRSMHSASSLTVSAFGKDPAFNPSSTLFSRTAAMNEADFYNMSSGSPEVTDSGFPAAFIPGSVLQTSPSFTIVFPVRSYEHWLLVMQ
jgi:hypothetical protein